jgi:ferredoxin
MSFGLWATLIYFTHYPMQSWVAQHIPVSLFLRIDPLVMTVVCGGMRVGVTITLLGFVTLAVSLLMGRVFCGWICPLGATFDFYGWFLKRLRVPFEGPSPSWFRLKYYLLLALMIFAVLGGVSPLMGFDPIVILTRVAATVVAPLARHGDPQLLLPGQAQLGYVGGLLDIGTLLLFLGIMVGTTRVSRIWCRTACPLGAYLAIASRHSALRRVTDGCVQCGICANHCPTGAIDFKNQEIYTESECIKCFACSQECPVDANQFKWVNPLPATQPSYLPVDLGRRRLLQTTAATLVAAPILRLEAGEHRSQKKLLRPPMSREEPDFLSSCIRCNECTKACPSGILQPAGLEHGLRALWSPVMVASEGACREGCNACSQACPTDAILKYPVEKKYAFKAGTAVFRSDQCISFSDRKFCSECVRVCPTNAIEVSKGWKPPGGKGSEMPAPVGQVPERPVAINFDQCVGCGACEYVCHQIVLGEPAMVLTSYGRAVPTKFSET